MAAAAALASVGCWPRLCRACGRCGSLRAVFLLPFVIGRFGFYLKMTTFERMYSCVLCNCSRQLLCIDLPILIYTIYILLRALDICRSLSIL